MMKKTNNSHSVHHASLGAKQPPMTKKLRTVPVWLVLGCCLALFVGHAQGSTMEASAIHMEAMGDLSILELEDYHVPEEEPVKLEGVELPAVRHLINGKMLTRNGHGLRSFAFYGLSYKMYVASFYSQVSFRSAEQVLEQPSSDMLFEFTFLRSVSKSRVKLAWQKQLDWSVSYTYEGFVQDRDAFIGMFGPMADQGAVTVQFVGEETLIFDQGELKGTIKGKNFQRAFLSMWFGEKAVADDLKVALLGNSSSQQEQVLV